MTLSLIITVGGGALVAGFVAGLAGFGTGLVALGFWLHVIDPVVAAPLVVICSVVAQAHTLPAIRQGIRWPRLWPFLLGGLLGIPIGVAALTAIEPDRFRAAVGLFLLAYGSFMLFARTMPKVAGGGRLADGAVGFGGGVLGGAAGLSGPLPTIWSGLRGWAKDEQRGVYQPYNLAILTVTLGAYAIEGVLNAQVGMLAIICLPGTLIGSWLGIKCYGRVNDRQFRTIILWLLVASGLTLTLASIIVV